MLRIELQDRVIMLDEYILRRIQATWRGKLLRKQMSKLQSEYCKIAEETEQQPSLSITWSGSPIGYPVFVQKPVISKETLSAKNGVISVNPKNVVSANQQQGEIDCTAKRFPPSYYKTSSSHHNENHSRLSSSNITGVCEHHIQDADAKQNSVHRSSIINQHDLIVEELCQPHDVKEVQQSQGNNSQRLAPMEHDTNEISQKEHEPHSHVTNFHEKVSSPSLNWNETTSVWNSFDASTINSPKKPEKENQRLTLQDLSNDELQIARSHIAMELLWIQQAINSRKQYLQIKSQIGVKR